MSTAIRLQHVSKRYRLGSGAGNIREAIALLPRRWLRGGQGSHQPGELLDAVQDLSFDLERGESLGIIGRNGAGKTTLLRILSGITRPTSGYVARSGRVSALIELGAGFHPDLTGRENVYLNGSILGLKRHEIDRKFDEIVAFAELERFLDTPVKRYSSGMYVRLGFAVAVHTRPDILLVDEVLSVGDVGFQSKCLNRIGEMQREGLTAVLVSHNMVLIRRHCARAMLLEAGRKVVEGDPGSVIGAFEERQSQQASLGLGGQRGARSAGVTLRVRVASVSLADAVGREVTMVDSGEPFRVRIRYEANARVKDPIFEVVLFSAVLGSMLVRMDNRVYGQEFGEIGPGHGEVEVCLSGLPIKTDRLDVSVSVFSSDYGELFDWRERVASFGVRSNFIGEGMVHLGATWTHGSRG